MNVWMLTGDKQETAMNIGYATRMLQESQDIMVVTSETMHPIENCILEFQKKKEALAQISVAREWLVRAELAVTFLMLRRATPRLVACN